jgi:hypothetical protein
VRRRGAPSSHLKSGHLCFSRRSHAAHVSGAFAQARSLVRGCVLAGREVLAGRSARFVGLRAKARQVRLPLFERGFETLRAPLEDNRYS